MTRWQCDFVSNVGQNTVLAGPESSGIVGLPPFGMVLTRSPYSCHIAGTGIGRVTIAGRTGIAGVSPYAAGRNLPVRSASNSKLTFGILEEIRPGDMVKEPEPEWLGTADWAMSSNFPLQLSL